jgi:hypothetical protein
MGQRDNKEHYNKKCPCTPSDFIGFWVNSLVLVNEDQWRSSEFPGIVNVD